jgi:hypothetical protein
MSTLWQETTGHDWQSIPVRSGATLDGDQIGVPGIALFGLTQGAQRGALLMVRPGVWVRVNGLPVLGGARVLEHKDEVLVGSVRLCFSAESAPVLKIYKVPEGGRASVCPICRGPIKDGMTAVQCPGCGRWFHQLEAADGKPAKPCWTYAPTCRFCGHPTAFGTEAAWRPDQEDSHG